MTKRIEQRYDYVDEGIRVVHVEDWFIYVVRESDQQMFFYNTELWVEWLTTPSRCDHPARFTGAPNLDKLGPFPCQCACLVGDMIPHAHNYTPTPLDITLDQFNDPNW